MWIAQLAVTLSYSLVGPGHGTQSIGNFNFRVDGVDSICTAELWRESGLLG